MTPLSTSPTLAAVERRLHSTSTASRHRRAWWTRALAGATPVPDLASMWGQPEAGAAGRATLPVLLSREVGSELHRLVADVPIRLLAILAAATGAVAASYAEKADILVGTPADSGPDESWRLLPLRVRAEPNDTVGDLMDRALRTTAEAVRAAAGLPPHDLFGAPGTTTMTVSVEPAQSGPRTSVLACVGRWEGGQVHVTVEADLGAIGMDLAREVAAGIGATLTAMACRRGELMSWQGRARSTATDPHTGTPAAMTSTQRLVAQLYRQILEVDDVGPDDDFFELGGHSLLALELVAELRDRVRGDAAARDVFEARTVRALADRLSTPG
jgi:hypothetical protein